MCTTDVLLLVVYLEIHVYKIKKKYVPQTFCSFKKILMSTAYIEHV